MARCNHLGFISVILLLLPAFASAQAVQSTLVSIETTRGAKQAFILINPDKPVAS